MAHSKYVFEWSRVTCVTGWKQRAVWTLYEKPALLFPRRHSRSTHHKINRDGGGGVKKTTFPLFYSHRWTKYGCLSGFQALYIRSNEDDQHVEEREDSVMLPSLQKACLHVAVTVPWHLQINCDGNSWVETDFIGQRNTNVFLIFWRANACKRDTIVSYRSTKC